MRGLLVTVFLLLAGIAHGANHSAETRGEYLTRLADCRTCHTRSGHAPFSGGVPIKTPFGTIYTPNITPDNQMGIGEWSFDEFYRALHLGLDRHGDYLFPAFPFPSYTLLKRQDVKAIYDYLKTIKPVRLSRPPNALKWPYSMRGLMKVWRALYFEPGTFTPNPDLSGQDNRGAYIVRGLAHCGACHTPRNRLGASMQDSHALAGGSVPIDAWYAPNITPNPHVGIGNWPDEALKAFLTTGRSRHDAALGPMRDVVQTSLQYLSDADIDAVVSYLRRVPAIGPQKFDVPRYPNGKKQAKLPGAKLYQNHCADCHGKQGRAKNDYYPDLRDNPTVLSRNPTNLVLIILRGGFQAATDAHPYPYSMPPFGFKLGDNEVAVIANYVRRNWNRRAVRPIYGKDVGAMR